MLVKASSLLSLSTFASWGCSLTFHDFGASSLTPMSTQKHVTMSSPVAPLRRRLVGGHPRPRSDVESTAVLLQMRGADSITTD